MLDLSQLRTSPHVLCQFEARFFEAMRHHFLPSPPPPLAQLPSMLPNVPPDGPQPDTNSAFYFARHGAPIMLRVLLVESVAEPHTRTNPVSAAAHPVDSNRGCSIELCAGGIEATIKQLDQTSVSLNQSGAEVGDGAADTTHCKLWLVVHVLNGFHGESHGHHCHTIARCKVWHKFGTSLAQVRTAQVREALCNLCIRPSPPQRWRGLARRWGRVASTRSTWSVAPSCLILPLGVADRGTRQPDETEPGDKSALDLLTTNLRAATAEALLAVLSHCLIY